MAIESGNGNSNATEITMDNLLNTGVGTNREPITPEEVKVIPEVPNTPNAPATNTKQTDVPPTESTGDNKANLQNLFTSFVNEDGLDEGNKEIRKGLLDQYKGEAFDAAGNILDKDGNIVANFSDMYEEYSKEDALTLDDKGNQINDKGEVVKTAVEVAIETTVVNKLHSESEYEFLNDDGTTKIYSDDSAGFSEFTKDVSAQRFEEFKGEFFGQHPELTEVAKHLLSGGTLDTFQKSTDYSSLDIATMTKEDKLHYIRQSYESAGLPKDRVDGLLQLFIDANLIDSEITKALPALQANDAKVKQQRDAQYQASIDERNARVEQYWNEVNNIVTKGDLGAINIPDTDKAGFFTYISQAADDRGNSKEFLDKAKETREQELMVSYLRYKGFDLGKLVDTKAKSSRVLSLKEQIQRSARITPNTVNESRQNTKTSGEDITIANMLG